MCCLITCIVFLSGKRVRVAKIPSLTNILSRSLDAGPTGFKLFSIAHYNQVGNIEPGLVRGRD